MFVCDDRSLANGHVVKQSQSAGANLLLDSDAHKIDELLTREFAMKVALGAGLDEKDAIDLLDRAPLELMARLGVVP